MVTERIQNNKQISEIRVTHSKTFPVLARCLSLPGLRRDHELFGEVLGRILSDHGTVSFRHGTGVPAHTTDIATIKDDGRHVHLESKKVWVVFRNGSFKHLEETDLDMGPILNSLGRE